MEITSVIRNGISYFSLRIGQEEAGRTIRSFLTGELGLSNKKISSVKFADEGILLEGTRALVTETVQAGQELLVRMGDSDRKRDTLVPVEMPLEILYEDPYLLIVNKPAGIPSHPSRGHYKDTLMNGIRAHLGPGEHPHTVGRLDQDTSGVFLAAKNAVTARYLQDLRESGQLHRTYLAIASGRMEASGMITLPMRKVRREDGLELMQPDPDGLEAETSWKKLAGSDAASLLAVRIRTGRMHQIRFHMSRVGHALLGDPLYGAGAGDTGQGAGAGAGDTGQGADGSAGDTGQGADGSAGAAGQGVDGSVGTAGESVSAGTGDSGAAKALNCGLMNRTALHACCLEFVHPHTKELLRVSAPLPEDFSRALAELFEEPERRGEGLETGNDRTLGTGNCEAMGTGSGPEIVEQVRRMLRDGCIW